MNSKLSPETIEEIRTAAGKQRDVARRYGISQAQVSRIQTHKSWSNRIQELEDALRYIAFQSADYSEAVSVAKRVLM